MVGVSKKEIRKNSCTMFFVTFRDLKQTPMYTEHIEHGTVLRLKVLPIDRIDEAFLTFG